MSIIKINNVVSGGQTTAVPATRTQLVKPFSPDQISGLAGWWDFSSASYLKQNADGTGTVTASSAIGFVQDRSGNNRHLTQTDAARKPTYVAALSGGFAASFTSDFLAAPVIALSSSGASLFIVAQSSLTTPSGGALHSFVGDSNGFSNHHVWTTNMFFSSFARSSRIAFAANQRTDLLITESHNQRGINLAESYFYNGALLYFSASNAIVAPQNATVVPGIGGYLNTDGSYAYSGTGEYKEVLLFSSPLSDADIFKVRAYLAIKHGIQLAPQVADSEAQAWVDNVYKYGGAVTQQTAAAVSTFCAGIATAGLRNKFYRMNLICGDNISAAAVPVYRSWSPLRSVNLVAQSELFSTWSTTNCTVALTTATPPPTPVKQAVALTETADGQKQVAAPSVTTIINGQLVASVYFKANTRAAAYVQLVDGTAANNIYGYYDLTNLVSTHSNYGAGTAAVTTSILDVGNGWRRCVLSVSNLVAGSSGEFKFGPADYGAAGPSRHSFLSNASVSIYFAGAQLERGAAVTDYEPPQYGNVVDALTNFPATSYQNNGKAAGLLGVLNSSYLNTGLPQNTAAVNDRHMAVYEAPPLPTNSYATLIASGESAVNLSWFIGYTQPPTIVRYSGLGSSSSYAIDTADNLGEAFWVGTNNATQATLYKNGLAAAAATNNSSPQTTNASNVVVFGVSAAANAQNPNSRLRAYSVGTHLTANEAATYNSLMQNFQHTLWRTIGRDFALHPDAQNWYQRVIENGGAANENTVRAVSDFCATVDAADLRDKIYRLNLFAGDNLNAALVPLYCGPVNGWATKNLIGLNEHFSRWLLNWVNVTSNAIVAPNGTMTADLIVENNTIVTNYAVRQNFDMAANTTYTWSVYAKKKDLRYLQLNCYNGQNSGAYFDLDNGTVSSTFGTASNHTITSAGNGWWRCSVTVTNVTATNDRPMYIAPTSVSNDSGHAGVIGAGTYLWGAQLEVGALTAYAPRCHGGLLDINTGYAATDYTLATGFSANTTSGTKHLVLSNKPLRSIIPDLGWSTQGGHMASTFATNATWSGNRRTLGIFQNVNGSGGSYGFSVSNNGSQSGTAGGTWGASGTSVAFSFDNTYRHFILSRTSNTLFKMYLNGAYQAQTTNNTTTYLNTKVRLASGTSFYDTTDGTGVESNPYETWPGRIADYSIGMSLDDTQAANLSAAFIAFRTAIGRS